MYIINNIDRPLGIHTYGVQKKYNVKEHYTPLVNGGGVHYINIPDSKAIGGQRKVDIKGKDKNGNYIGTDGKIYDKVSGKVIPTSQSQTFNTERKRVFPLYNPITKKLHTIIIAMLGMQQKKKY